jgi:hypothetical protein
LNELAQLDLGKAWHAFARAAISVKLKCALDPTKRYVAFADDATYVLQPESKGDQWRFHKTFFDGTTEECKHVMDVELVDWFEWLRVPYDLDWQMTPVDAAVEAEARKGEQR